MKICDNCDCETDELIKLSKWFDNLEICKACNKVIVKRFKEIDDRVIKVADRARRRAFDSWREEIPLRMKARRMFGILDAITHAMFSGDR